MAGRRPDYIAHSVVQVSGFNRWREVGVAFWNERKDTLTVLLDSVPLSGKVVLAARPMRELEAESREPGVEG
jgi:hypothetical protein